MNFAQAVEQKRKFNLSNKARTANDMKALKSTQDACVDLFYKVGASRGKDITKEFSRAYQENKELACRIMLWARDVRKGAGERQLFRDFLLWLEPFNQDFVIALLEKAIELGRWDDLLLEFKTDKVQSYVLSRYRKAIVEEKNGLAAKWAPRKGIWAVRLRNAFGMTPKQYRKTLVRLTNVVEQKMCANAWGNIDFNKVPSLAHARYRRAFMRNAEYAFSNYIEQVKQGKAKINASAVYPYDVLRDISSLKHKSYSELQHIEVQWNALPNYVKDAKVLPVVDVSGSMFTKLHNSPLKFVDISVALGLYFADKNTGAFKDVICTFSEKPKLMRLGGNIISKANSLIRADWGYSTNLHATFDLVLNTAKQYNINPTDMPDVIFILSDMQFNQCTEFDDRAIEMIKRKYHQAGYEVPKIVFWNLNSYENVPVKFNEFGVALVSGFSPAIAKNVLENIQDLNPRQVMLSTVMVPRYNF